MIWRTALGVGLAAGIGGCLLAPPAMMRGLGHPLFVLGALLSVAVVAAVAREGWRHSRLAVSLGRLARPEVLSGHPVGVIPGLSGAVVAGVRRPRIFCGHDLSSRLAPDELQAVILHERHHQLAGAPFRLVIIAAIGSLLRRLEAGRAWIERERARIEIAADAYALAAGASRNALARALVKLGSGPALGVVPGFATAADLRVRALLGERTGIEDRRGSGVVATAVLVVLSCLVVLLLR